MVKSVQTFLKNEPVDNYNDAQSNSTILVNGPVSGDNTYNAQINPNLEQIPEVEINDTINQAEVHSPKSDTHCGSIETYGADSETESENFGLIPHAPVDSESDEPEREEREGKTVECDICGAVFSCQFRFEFLARHKKTEHDQIDHAAESFFMENSSKTGNNKTEPYHYIDTVNHYDYMQQIHMPTVLIVPLSMSSLPAVKKSRRHQCSVCDKRFSRQTVLKTHVDAVHNNLRPFECKQCGKKFGQSTSLNRHVKAVHEKQKPHQCTKCGACFGRICSLKLHIKAVHDGRKPFKCSYCGKGFGRRDLVKSHTRLVHEKLRPFSCSHCEKKFGKSNHLSAHINLVHHKLKPFKCGQCGMCFGRSCHLNSHVVRIHGERKPYQCYHCDKRFRLRSLLSAHISAVHTSYLTCRQCDTRFRSMSNLKSHTRAVHDKLQPHQCEHCGRRFSRSSTLKRHVLAKHK